MAGLLTFSFPVCLPISRFDTDSQWRGLPETIPEITAAGTVQDLHLIPYYPESGFGFRNHNSDKYKKNFYLTGK
jgi:hypothetical protein